MSEAEWIKHATEALVGKRIAGVQWMSREDTDKNGWHRRPIQIILDDGNWIAPMMDDEGNDAGALAATGDIETWPVLS